MVKKYTSYKAFSIIEVMVGIFIFSLWLVSIYALLASSLNTSDYSKNAIIASNLAREQIELFKNIRDTNYTQLNVWNQMNPNIAYDESSNLFETGKYYTLENNFNVSDNFSISVHEITSFQEWEDKLATMTNYQLCMDSEGMYSSDCSWDAVKTPFYRYLFLEPVIDVSKVSIDNAYKVRSKVIWYKRGYHEFYIDTVVADWRRI